MGQKRRRIALSCVDCRRRKVKCDRTYPSCVRCQKGGYGDKCTYVTHTGEQHDPGLPTPEDDRASVRQSVRENSWVEDTTQWQSIAEKNADIAVGESSTTAQPQQLQRLPPPPPRPLGDANDRKIGQLQHRLMDLETYVYQAGGKPVSSNFNAGLANPAGPGGQRPGNPYSNDAVLTENEKVLMRGNSFKTQYFGPSHDLSVLLQFEELSQFVKDILIALPSLSNAKRSLAGLREKEKKAERAYYDLSMEAFIAKVPDRAFCDRLLREYLNNFESTYRVLHVPSFLQEYEAYWLNPKDARAEFLVQLLLALAMVYCVVPGGEEGYVGRSSARRETALHWINVCQRWTDEHSHKHTDLAYYQVIVLLWLAKRMNCMKIKREWTTAGHLVRVFIASGMHREPSLLSNKITIFDQEMRRRLWYTVLAIDHQATIDRGMTPSIGAFDWDALPPRNIDDEAFDAKSDRLPDPKPRNTFTRTSFLIWMAHTLPLRIEMLHKINSIRSELDLETILHYDDKVRECFEDLPVAEWEASAVTNNVTTLRPAMTPGTTVNTPMATSTSAGSPRTVRSGPMISSANTPAAGHNSTATQFPLDAKMACTLAQLMLYELIIILHQPLAALSGVPESSPRSLATRHFLSRAARRDACMSAIYLYSPFDPTDPTSGQATTLQSRLLASLRDCSVRAALSLAQDLATSGTNNPYATLDTRRAINQIDNTVLMLDDRVRNLGQGFHSYWIVSSALSFVHAKQNPDVPRTTFTRAAADRVIKLHDAVLAGQLPRARRMLADMEQDGNGTGKRDKLLDWRGTRGAKNNVEQVTSVDGAIDLQGTEPLLPLSGEGTKGMIDPLMGDGMFGLEDFDWTAVMNADPMIFMGGGGWDVAA